MPRFSPSTILRVGIDVAKGLRAALEQGLIHRDIKPANILLARDGAAKVVDFGLAQLNHVARGASDETSVPRTTITGTIGYAAPEQVATPDRVDFRADIYALGVTLYQATVGSLPFSSADTGLCIAAHRDDPVPPPEKIVPGIPRPLSWTILRMLAKKPTERPNSYDVLIAALERVLEGLGPTSTLR